MRVILILLLSYSVSAQTVALSGDYLGGKSGVGVRVRWEISESKDILELNPKIVSDGSYRLSLKTNAALYSFRRDHSLLFVGIGAYYNSASRLIIPEFRIGTTNYFNNFAVDVGLATDLEMIFFEESPRLLLEIRLAYLLWNGE